MSSKFWCDVEIKLYFAHSHISFLRKEIESGNFWGKTQKMPQITISMYFFTPDRLVTLSRANSNILVRFSKISARFSKIFVRFMKSFNVAQNCCKSQYLCKKCKSGRWWDSNELVRRSPYDFRGFRNPSIFPEIFSKSCRIPWRRLGILL